MHKKHIFLRVFSKIAIFACVFCAFFISPVFATLPTGYTELEYIDNDGSAYLDLGMPIGTSDKVTFDIAWNSLKGVPWFGAYNSGGNYDRDSFVGTYCSAANTKCFYPNTSSSQVFSGLQVNTRYVIKWNGINERPSLDGVEFGGGSSYSDFTPNVNAYLGTRNQGGVAGSIDDISIYGFEVEGKMKLVPAKRDSDGEIGMYDKVSNTFFTNHGTGDFIAGPDTNSIIKIATTKMVDEEFAAAEAKLATTVQTIESVVSRTIDQAGDISRLQAEKQTRPDETCPAGKKCLLVTDENGTPHWYEIIENIYGLPAGYNALQYIESTGTQWIDTGIKGYMGYTYELDFQQTDKGNYRSWGVFGQSSFTGLNMSFTYCSGWCSRWESRSGQSASVGVGSIDVNRHVLRIVNGHVYLDGVDKGVSAGHNTDAVINYNLFLGTANPAGTTPSTNAKSKYYAYKVWNKQGDLIQNLVPAQDASGNVGMYDTVSNVFLVSVGSGSFVAGPVMP